MLYLFFRILSWAIPLITAYLILFHFEDMIHWGIWSSIISPQDINNAIHFSLSHRFVILAIQFMPISITILICHKLAKLFRLYEQGDLFEEENIKLIKSISIYMILGELFQLLYQPLISAALSFNNPIGERVANISFGTTNITTLITACIILVASWVVEEANRLKSDSHLTI